MIIVKSDKRNYLNNVNNKLFKKKYILRKIYKKEIIKYKDNKIFKFLSKKDYTNNNLYNVNGEMIFPKRIKITNEKFFKENNISIDSNVLNNDFKTESEFKNHKVEIENKEKIKKKIIKDLKQENFFFLFYK